MKRLFPQMVSGVIGGVVTLIGVYLLAPQSYLPPAMGNRSQLVKHFNISPQDVPAVPESFSVGAQKAMEVVVHISTLSSKTTAGSSKNRDPFKFFFDDDFLVNPFGSPEPRKGTGSGVIYSTDGYIITNNHVVDLAEKIHVTLFDNREFEAKIIGKDKKTDLAVLKIEAHDLPVLELADSDAAKVGEWVLAVGNPFDLTSTVTAGIISAKGRDINLLGNNSSIEAFIQTDAAVNPGNSGGALVTPNGDLLGINTAIATNTGVFSGYSFAIPINLADKIVADIIEFGTYQKASLDVFIYPMDNDVAKELGVSITQGVVIDELIDGGTAQYAGLLPKDIIIKVNGKQIKGIPDLQEIIGRAKIGDILNVVIVRKGEELEIPVRMRSQN